ncbi:MAG: hypothetical protein J6S71_02940, partial [Clostridia bacterium]|nr:hypothetical protein [Clostridia bacterium]
TALGEGFATIELIHADEAEAGYEVNVIDEKNIILPYGYVKPSGKLTIKENGTYNVRNYESVEVNVSTSENLDTDLTSIESKIADLNAILDELGAVGYTVTIQGAYDEDYGACATYSLDNGSTWESINGYDLVLDNVKEIMFKRVGDAPIDEMKYWKESEYDEDLDPIDYDDFYFNQNYTLTENTTFRFYAAW